MVNPMKAIVHQELAERSEMNVDWRMNQVGQKHHDKADHGRRNRMVVLDQAQGEGDEEQMGPDLGGVTDVVCRVKLGRRMMHRVDRPEPLMFSAMAAVDEEVRNGENDNGFKGTSRNAVGR